MKNTWLLVFCFGIMACQSNHSGNKQVFNYNRIEGIATLDPAFARNQAVMWAVKHLYNTLLEPDDHMILQPSLATHWTISTDRRTYTFYLRPDVYFHDSNLFPGGKGRRMVAADVVYSLRRIMDPATASPGAWIFNGKVEANGFKALNDTVFQLTLLQPFHPILDILTMQYCSIIPHEAVERYGKDFRKHPCGTGPFQFFLWDEGQALVLHKNPHYFETDRNGQRLPYLDAVKVTFLDSKGSEFLLFRQGQLDFINDIDASFKDEVLTRLGTLQPAWKGRMVLDKAPQLNVEYFGILMDSTAAQVMHSPLRLLKIRQAINYGIDRAKLITYLRNGIGKPATAGFVPIGLPSFSAALKGYDYNPTRAAQLLSEAGFPQGRGLPSITLMSVPIYEDYANYAAGQLADIGIKVKVEVMDKNLLLEQTAKSASPFFRASWIADYPDAESFLAVFYSKNTAPPNYTRYNNPVFDALYEKALQENNDTIRYGLYRQMDSLVLCDAPVVPLYYDEVIHLVQPGITGFTNNALNLLDLRRVKKVFNKSL
ncbi:peptide/nickel transport system substrate-binding protein [Chitinophaga costaii]|uniref:Peptide/nickel transport system substrate-binding protein n=1 Tax=Chitinophaga costaii TaxID=1335309 RepID=A0A1C4FG01_9BACT|nr:ABC transporter substrate-binding protein [Chitinophaga costaii]PUZ20130.1 ABC transporter substrate-binding protein [Chitinophaga costaii]SCC54782.1 peptide/nickel transport system substrate-binding protein [Chitinophaga costaii]